MNQRMTRSKPFDFALEVARGEIYGVGSIAKFGRNLDVDAGTTPEDVWAIGGLWQHLTVAERINVASDDDLDTILGTGARTLTLQGLDGDCLPIEETIETDGQNDVLTDLAFFRLYRKWVVTSGELLTNAGNITATPSVSTSKPQARIVAGEGQTEQAIYTTSALQKGYLTSYYGGFTRAQTAGSLLELHLMMRPSILINPTAAWRVQHTLPVFISGMNPGRQPLDSYIEVPPCSDVRLEVSFVSANSTLVHGGFHMSLVDLPG